MSILSENGKKREFDTLSGREKVKKFLEKFD